MVERGEFLEHARVFGKHWYGTPRKWLEEARTQKRDLVLEIDVQGAEQVRKKLPDAVAIFIVPPSRQELEQRIRARGQDSAKRKSARRLERARQEMEHYRGLRLSWWSTKMLDRAGRSGQGHCIGRAVPRRSEIDERVRKILKSSEDRALMPVSARHLKASLRM